MTGRSRRTRTAAALLAAARFGHAWWLFGNVYEAVVRVPDRIADAEERTSPFGPGSPARYYAAAAPALTPALLAATATGWNQRTSRRPLAVATTCSTAATVLTVFLVRHVNLTLFFGVDRVPEDERGRLLRTWHRVNVVRIALTAIAWLATHRATKALDGAGT